MNNANYPKDMAAALSKFDETATNIVEPFMKELDAKPIPPLIYHYTTDLGLKGILETGKIWLTDIFYLNDPSELSHGFSHVVDILKSKAENGPPEASIFAKHMNAFHDQGMQGSAHYFVSSFSSESDELGQWRAYADNGRGYALGFDAKELEDAFVRKDGIEIPSNATFPITYDDQELRRIHAELVDAMFGLISLPLGRNLSSDALTSYMIDLSSYLSVYALRAALFFKHKAYSNEREFRFLQIYQAGLPLTDVKRRNRSHELIRYTDFDWKQLRPKALKRILIGPAADRTKASRFASDCLAAFHTKDVKVDWSQIPYRTT